MIHPRRDSALRGWSRAILFGLTLAFLVSWLTAPETIRRGRNAAVGYLHVRPEPHPEASAPLVSRAEPANDEGIRELALGEDVKAALPAVVSVPVTSPVSGGPAGS